MRDLRGQVWDLGVVVKGQVEPGTVCRVQGQRPLEVSSLSEEGNTQLLLED